MAVPQHERIAKCTTEFVGTMFLCLTVALSAESSSTAAIAIGCVLMVLVYAGGHISGAHYNPAVTFAIVVAGRGKITAMDAIMYVMSQLVGAIVAALLSWALIGQSAAAYPALGANVGVGPAIVGELVVTFALCSVVLHVATTKAQANNSYYGLAIGFTVLSGAISIGPVSGGAFNPAVGLMPFLYGGSAAANAWIYFVGPVAASVLAGLCFRVCALEEYTDTPKQIQALIAACVIEAVGTMFLCFTVGTAAGGGSFLAPLSIGSALMVMVYMGGAISGSHYNPAVTLGLLMRTYFGALDDDFTIKKAALYVPSQIVGAAIGTFAAWAVMESNASVGYPALPSSTDISAGILGELLGTFLLVYVVLNVATVKELAGNSFFGLAIGMVVTSMACAIGPVTGGAFNPAVGLIGVFSLGAGASISNVWIYWVGCPVGALLAAAFFRLQNCSEFEKEDDGEQHFMRHASHEKDKEKFMCYAQGSHRGIKKKKEVNEV